MDAESQFSPVKDAETQQLHAAYDAVLQSSDNAQDQTDKLNAHIGALRSLLTRTANWISDPKPLTYDRNQERLQLIDELRKAASSNPQSHTLPDGYQWSTSGLTTPPA